MNKFRKAIRKTSTNIQRPPSPPSDPPLSLSLEQVSTYERRLFETQWIELNPFDLGLVSLDTLPPPPRNRSFSDPFVSVTPDNGLHRQRHSVDTSSLLLMESFAPSPSKRHAIHLNLRPNLLHQPAPPVPPQHTKPAQLSHVHGIKSNINIFDTPPHYRRHFNHADQKSFIPSID
ncbi:hypothetical protein [Absidia glauca]|uniref:Uncharacterized protein n=1 Tax=Absidia glauca TaxID=4829 RepID=A0A168QYW1_ABSGL|nr:hypothetical protein [Absidia glauca]